MPSLKDVVAQAHGLAPTPGQGTDPVLEPYYVPLHLAWLKLDEKDRQWSEAAIEHAQKFFSGGYARERSARISASALGNACERETLFSFGGAPQLPAPVISEDVMESGTFEHVRWQMEGLSLPFLSDVEVWAHHPDLRCGGSMDGIGLDGSLWEFKNTASHLFDGIARGRGTAKRYATEMVKKHKLQMEAYFLLDSMQDTPRLNGMGSLVYQDRASKETYEIRLRTSPSRRRQVNAILEGLHDWIDLNQLPDMLEGCWKATHRGEAPSDSERTVYLRCSYREHCPTATMVTTG